QGSSERASRRPPGWTGASRAVAHPRSQSRGLAARIGATFPRGIQAPNRAAYGPRYAMRGTPLSAALAEAPAREARKCAPIPDWRALEAARRETGNLRWLRAYQAADDSARRTCRLTTP